MTESRDLKRLVRQRMAKTGESYTTALAHFRRRPAAGGESVEDFRARMYTRAGLDRLGAHLEERYGTAVTTMTELDVGVFRIGRAGGRSWVARVFPSSRPIEHVHGDAELLARLEERGFAAERCAHPDAVSVLDGQGVLVTDYVEGLGARTDARGTTLFGLGDLLGRLHTMRLETTAGAASRPAGSWHHISARGGGFDEDVALLAPLLAAAVETAPPADRDGLTAMAERLATTDACADLPHALTHPDPCGANAVVSTAGHPVLVDWAGAGRGSRLLALASLVGGSLHMHPGLPISRELRRVDAVVAGYREHVRPSPQELDRLAGAIAAINVRLCVWIVLFQALTPDDAARMISNGDRLAEVASERVAAALDRDTDELVAWFAGSRRVPAVHPDQGTLL